MEAILWQWSHTLPEHFEDENCHGLTTRLPDILSPILASISAVRLPHGSARRTQLPSLKVSRDSSEWGSTQHLTAPNIIWNWKTNTWTNAPQHPPTFMCSEADQHTSSATDPTPLCHWALSTHLQGHTCVDHESQRCISEANKQNMVVTGTQKHSANCTNFYILKNTSQKNKRKVVVYFFYNATCTKLRKEAANYHLWLDINQHWVCNYRLLVLQHLFSQLHFMQNCTSPSNASSTATAITQPLACQQVQKHYF